MRKILSSFFGKLSERLKQTEILEESREEKDRGAPSPPYKTKKQSKRKKEEKLDRISAAEEVGKEIGLSRSQMKLLLIAGEIQLDQDKTESAFMARQLVQATLPHKNPGNVPAWSRTNGGLTVTIQPGLNSKQKITGYPYGTLPRLLMFWLTTEAVRTNSRHIELGNNLAEFMETLGLNSKMGGKRSDVKRLQDQMRRLFHSRISFTQNSQGEMWINMQVTSKGMLWWDSKKPSQSTLWESWIEIGEEFFKAITSAPVPVDMRALKALKRSPLALDLYAWTTYTAYQTQKTNKSRSVSWELLHQQFGSEYTDIKNFSKKAWKALLKVQVVYPQLIIERVSGGIKLIPSKPSITIKQKRIKITSI